MASIKGYLIISDIRGYTSFLHDSELEHAEDILRALLENLIENTRIPLVISRLEGDAVISYSPEGSLLQGQTLVEMIETTYVAFRRAIELMILNTSCTCNACRNIPQLDLKFFVHYGTFALQELPAYTELVGNDVNLIHRLTKNHVAEKTSYKAYVLYTQAAVAAMGIEELAETMQTHLENYEHIGDVQVYVEDMRAVWEASCNTSRTNVEAADAVVTIDMDFPADPVVAWDFATKPEYRALLSKSESANVTGRTKGRLGPGATYQCVHGKDVSPQMIVDWQPFDEYTYEYPLFVGIRARTTMKFSPRANGTHIVYRQGKALGGSVLARWIFDLYSRFFLPRFVKDGGNRLNAQYEQDKAAGLIVVPAATTVPDEAKGQAVKNSLTVSTV